MKDQLTKEEMIDLGITNNIPEELEKIRNMRLESFDLYLKYAGKLILASIVLLIGISIYACLHSDTKLNNNNGKSKVNVFHFINHLK